MLGFRGGAAAAGAGRGSRAACGGSARGLVARGRRRRGEEVEASVQAGQRVWRLALGLMRTADLEP